MNLVILSVCFVIETVVVLLNIDLQIIKQIQHQYHQYIHSPFQISLFSLPLLLLHFFFLGGALLIALAFAFLAGAALATLAPGAPGSTFGFATDLSPLAERPGSPGPIHSCENECDYEYK